MESSETCATSGSSRVLSHRDENGKHRYYYRPGEILVATNEMRLVADTLRRERAKVVRRVGGHLLLRVPVGDAVPALVARLRAIDGCRSATPNHVMQFAPHETWHPASPADPASPLRPLPQGEALAGSGVKVGVIDTGIAEHPWFGDRVKPARSWTDDAEERHEGQSSTLDFEAGHGTFVAGIILQYAPGAEVIVYGVADTNSRLDDAEAARAIRFLALGHGVDILNLSFGGLTEDSEKRAAATREALADARAWNKDLVVVAAAGNHPANEEPDPSVRFFPACEPDVIGVAALCRDGKTKAPFSNCGTWVQASAVGEDVVSTHLWWDGEAVVTPPDPPHHHDYTPTPRVVEHRSFRGWATWSGTSFAAPQVTGALAAAASPHGQGKGSLQEAAKQLIPTMNLLGQTVIPHNFVLQPVDRDSSHFEASGNSERAQDAGGPGREGSLVEDHRR